MEYKVIVSEEFKFWQDSLSDVELEDVLAYIGLLKVRGVNLPYPYSSKINYSPLKTKQMRRIKSSV